MGRAAVIKEGLNQALQGPVESHLEPGRRQRLAVHSSLQRGAGGRRAGTGMAPWKYIDGAEPRSFTGT